MQSVKDGILGNRGRRMTKKKKATMSFQSANALEDSTSDSGSEDYKSTTHGGTNLKCGLFPDRVIPRKSDLPNPRQFATLEIFRIIDRNNKKSLSVVQALYDKNIIFVEDLMGVHYSKIFGDLKDKISKDELLSFVIDVERAGVRFGPSK